MHPVDFCYFTFKEYLSTVRNSKRIKSKFIRFVKLRKLIFFLIPDLIALISARDIDNLYIGWRDNISPSLSSSVDYWENALLGNTFVVSYKFNHQCSAPFVRCESLAVLSFLLCILRFRNPFLPSSLLPLAHLVLRFLSPKRVLISDGYTSKCVWHYASLTANIPVYEVQHAHFDSTHYGLKLLNDVYLSFSMTPHLLIYSNDYITSARILNFIPKTVDECNFLQKAPSLSTTTRLSPPLSRVTSNSSLSSSSILVIGQPSYRHILLEFCSSYLNSLFFYRPHPLEVHADILNDATKLGISRLSLYEDDNFSSFDNILCHSSTMGIKLENEGYEVTWI